MTNVVIVHSQIGDSHNHWYAWLQHNLELEGYDVQLFHLDENKNDDIDNWVHELHQQIDILTTDTYFVTHGYGSIATLKYIEGLSVDGCFEGFFSIAGFKEDAVKIDDSIKVGNFSIDYDDVKSKVKHFYGLASRDDAYVSYIETQNLINELGGKTKIVDEGGHFLEEEGFVSFTELQEKMQHYMTR
ncbi:RBBP9/YdeN family alpha/beta hydrolase [Staphylococcus borealis]|uniref:RBBP9/YdeN family alpha/beta hydrolase n=1 Tax=Staphylococcus borealis TaxID=2742203 RepID=UPI000D1F7CE9|nr:alpha/beta hydrolase [Staphylococcus borealis]RIO87687.1 serine hydrolase family protein [Staphylococcus haemolyticus]MDM7864380.1 alpha/beta hydrolase [Staphylococcus borealis]MDM7883307.1 alpha/beta hydrolase [Staphylococcus borealis]PTK65533.1 serine hydrolase family protein [Staphylococcus borealis]RIO69233.1 serine hydrolase family protein [Staphylococcus borealis]